MPAMGITRVANITGLDVIGPLPAYVCDVLDAPDAGRRRLLGAYNGSGCHPSAEVALARAITEAVHRAAVGGDEPQGAARDLGQLAVRSTPSSYPPQVVSALGHFNGRPLAEALSAARESEPRSERGRRYPALRDGPDPAPGGLARTQPSLPR